MPQDPIPSDADAVEAVAHALADTRTKNLTATGLASVDEWQFVRGAIRLFLGDAAPPETTSSCPGVMTRHEQLGSRIRARATEINADLGPRKV